MRRVRRAVLSYLAIGFLVSCAINTVGFFKPDGVSAWSAFFGGSLRDRFLVLFFWFVMPMLIWPVVLYSLIKSWLTQPH